MRLVFFNTAEDLSRSLWKMIQQAADKMMKEKGILDLVQRQGAAAVLSSEVKNRYALLPWMAANGHEAIVGLLVEEGADLKAKDAYGYTPLHLASWRGNEATVRWLLKRGANFEAQDATNYTPLYMAVRNGHKGYCEVTTRKGGWFSRLKISDCNTPLQAAKSGHEIVVRSAGPNQHKCCLLGSWLQAGCLPGITCVFNSTRQPSLNSYPWATMHVS